MDPGVDPERLPGSLLSDLRAAGYEADLEVVEGAKVKDRGSGRIYEPESLTVDRTHRYEGDTNPGDEELILAVSDATGPKGTLVMAYGPAASADEAEVARRLEDDRG